MHPACILSTHDSHRRLRALNGYRTEQHPDCSFRNRLVGFRNRLLVGENPPPIKKTSSHKGNRANTAYRRPNPTRNFKKLAHYIPPLVCYLHVLRDARTYTFGTFAPRASSSQATSLARCHYCSSWIISSPRISFARRSLCQAI
jgi:DNA-directed RNA polymerase subunit RPC12/RpoP